MRSLVVHSVLALALFGSGCNDSSGYSVPGPRPRIVSASVVGDTPVVSCNPEKTGGACPVAVNVTFRLREDQVVTTSVVRFQRDGSDRGVDRFYPLSYPEPGLGEATDRTIAIDAAVPPNLVGSGSLFTFSVRLVTALGEQSDESTLTLTVTKEEQSRTADAGADAAAAP